MIADWPVGTLPRIVTAGRYRLADRGFPVAYRHPSLALHQHGYRARWSAGDDEHALVPGDVTVSPPGLVTRYDIAAPGQCWCVHLVAPGRAPGQRVLRLPAVVRPGAEARFFSERFARIVGWSARGGGAANEAARAAAYELLAALAALAVETFEPEGDRGALAAAVDAATARIERQYHRPLDVAKLCAELGVRQDALSAAFRRRHGCAILAYLARLRVEHAHLLLRTTDLPVAEVAAMVGIADRRYFTRIFRAVTGVGPRVVRRGQARGGG